MTGSKLSAENEFHQELKKIEHQLASLGILVERNFIENKFIACDRNLGFGDYFVFDFQAKKYAVLLPDGKKIRKEIIKKVKHICQLDQKRQQRKLKLQAEKEEIEKSLRSSMEKRQKHQLKTIQSHLLSYGIHLAGFDIGCQELGRLDELESLLAVLIAVILNRPNIYEFGKLNELDPTIESGLLKIKAQIAKDNITSEALERIIPIINAEYQDEGHLAAATILNAEKSYEEPNSQNGKQLILWKENSCYFALQHESSIKLKSHVWLELLFANVVAESELFSDVCLNRIKSHYQQDLIESDKLSSCYQQDMQCLARIQSFNEFNGEFYSYLDAKLFYYLSRIEQQERILGQDELLEKLQALKNQYKFAFIKVLTAEQERRNQQRLANLALCKEAEAQLLSLIDQNEQRQQAIHKQLNKKQSEITEQEHVVTTLITELADCEATHRRQVLKLEHLKSKISAQLESLSEELNSLKQKSDDNTQQIVAIEEKIIKEKESQEKVEAQIVEIKHKLDKASAKKLDLKQVQIKLKADKAIVAFERQKEEQILDETNEQLNQANAWIQFMNNVSAACHKMEVFAARKAIIEQLEGKKNDLKALYQTLISSESTLDAAWLFNKINRTDLEKYVDSSTNLLQEEKYESAERLYHLVLSLLGKIQGELVSESQLDESNDSIFIKKYKVLGNGHISYQDVLHSLKTKVEDELKKYRPGLHFDRNVLKVNKYGINSLGDLPPEIQPLIYDKIKIWYQQHEWSIREKNRAVDQLNELAINYKEIVNCYVDEIEIVTNSAFCLDTSDYYPGIDLTVRARQMHCGTLADRHAVILSTSGRDAEEFKHPKASGGYTKRRRRDTPEGDSGYPGEFGRDGQHAGNIVLKIDEYIENLELLELIELNGGRGAVGQHGGDGDKGYTAQNGKDGKAQDTHGIGGGQTTFDFGKLGGKSGNGGDAGLSGRGGRGGRAGSIVFEVAGINQSEQYKHKIKREPGFAGKDPDPNSQDAPLGGEGGDPTITGMDHVNNKDGFFYRTESLFGELDIDFLIKNNSNFEQAIKDKKGFGRVGVVGLGLLLGGAIGGTIALFIDRRIKYRFSLNEQEFKHNPRRVNETKGAKGKKSERQYRDESERSKQSLKRSVTVTKSLEHDLIDKRSELSKQQGDQHYVAVVKRLNSEKVKLVAHINEYNNKEQDFDSQISSKHQEITAIANEISHYEHMLNQLGQISSDSAEGINSELHKLIQLMQSQQKVRDIQNQKKLEQAIALATQRECAASGVDYQLAFQTLKDFIEAHLNEEQQVLELKQQEKLALEAELAQINAQQVEIKKRLLAQQEQKFALSQAQSILSEDVQEQIQQEVHVEHEIAYVPNNDDSIVYHARRKQVRSIEENPVTPFFAKFSCVLQTLVEGLNDGTGHVISLGEYQSTSIQSDDDMGLINFITKQNLILNAKDELLEVLVCFLLQHDWAEVDFMAISSALKGATSEITADKLTELLAKLQSTTHTNHALNHYIIFRKVLKAFIYRLHSLDLNQPKNRQAISVCFKYYQQAYRSVASAEVDFKEVHTLLADMEAYVISNSIDDEFRVLTSKFVSEMDKIALEKLFIAQNQFERTQILRQFKLVFDHLVKDRIEILSSQLKNDLLTQSKLWLEKLGSNDFLANLIPDLTKLVKGDLSYRNTLKRDIEQLINLFEASRFFNLAICSPEFHFNTLTPTELETQMLAYNKQPSFDGLVELLRAFENELKIKSQNHYGVLIGNSIRFMGVVEQNYEIFAQSELDLAQLTKFQNLLTHLVQECNLGTAQPLLEKVENKLWFCEQEIILEAKVVNKAQDRKNYFKLNEALKESYNAICQAHRDNTKDAKQNIHQELLALPIKPVKDVMQAILAITEKLNPNSFDALTKKGKQKCCKQNEVINLMMELEQAVYQRYPNISANLAALIKNNLLCLLSQIDSTDLALQAYRSRCKQQLSFILKDNDNQEYFYYLLQQLVEAKSFNRIELDDTQKSAIQPLKNFFNRDKVFNDLDEPNHILFNLNYSYSKVLLDQQQVANDEQHIQAKIKHIQAKIEQRRQFVQALDSNQNEIVQTIKVICVQQCASLAILLFRSQLQLKLTQNNTSELGEFLQKSFFTKQDAEYKKYIDAICEVTQMMDKTVVDRLVEYSFTQLQSEFSNIQQIGSLLAAIDFNLLAKPFEQIRTFNEHAGENEYLLNLVDQKYSEICTAHEDAVNAKLTRLIKKTGDNPEIASAIESVFLLLGNRESLYTNQTANYESLKAIIIQLDNYYECQLALMQKLQQLNTATEAKFITAIFSEQGELVTESIKEIKVIRINYKGSIYDFDLKNIKEDSEKRNWLQYLYFSENSKSSEDTWQKIKLNCLQQFVKKKNELSAKQFRHFLKIQETDDLVDNIFNKLKMLDIQSLHGKARSQVDVFIYHIQNNLNLFNIEHCNQFEKILAKLKDKTGRLTEVLNYSLAHLFSTEVDKTFQSLLVTQNKEQAGIEQSKQQIIDDYEKVLLSTEQKDKQQAKNLLSLYLEKLDRVLVANYQGDIDYTQRKAVFAQFTTQNLQDKKAIEIEELVANNLNQQIFYSYKKNSRTPKNKEAQSKILQIKQIVSLLNSEDIDKHQDKQFTVEGKTTKFKNKELEISTYFSNGKWLLEKAEKLKTHALTVTLSDQKEYYDLSWKSRDELLNRFVPQILNLYIKKIMKMLCQSVHEFNKEPSVSLVLSIAKQLNNLMVCDSLWLDKNQKAALKEFLTCYRTLLTNMAFLELSEQQILFDFAQGLDIFIENKLESNLQQSYIEPSSSLTEFKDEIEQLKNCLNYKVYKISKYALLAKERDELGQQPPSSIVICYQNTREAFNEIVAMANLLSLPQRSDFLSSILKQTTKYLTQVSETGLLKVENLLIKKFRKLITIRRAGKMNTNLLRIESSAIKTIVCHDKVNKEKNNVIKIVIRCLQQPQAIGSADWYWSMEQLKQFSDDKLVKLKFAVWEHYYHKLLRETVERLQQWKVESQVISYIINILVSTVERLFNILQMQGLPYLSLMDICEALVDKIDATITSDQLLTQSLQLVDEYIAEAMQAKQLYQTISSLTEIADIEAENSLITYLSLMLNVSPSYWRMDGRRKEFAELLEKLATLNTSARLDNLILDSFINYHQLFNEVNSTDEVIAILRFFNNNGYQKLFTYHHEIEALSSSQNRESANEENSIIKLITRNESIECFLSAEEKWHYDRIRVYLDDKQMLTTIFAMPIVTWHEELLALRLKLLQSRIWNGVVKAHLNSNEEEAFANCIASAYFFAQANLEPWFITVEIIADKIAANSLAISLQTVSKIISWLIDFADLSLVQNIILNQAPGIWFAEILFARLSIHLSPLLVGDKALEISNSLLSLKLQFADYPEMLPAFWECLTHKILEYNGTNQVMFDQELLDNIIKFVDENKSSLEVDIWEQLSAKPLSAWWTRLKKQQLASLLPFLINRNSKLSQKTIDYLYKIETDNPKNISKLIEILNSSTSQIKSISELNDILEKFAYGDYTLGETILKQLSDKAIENWEAILEHHSRQKIADLSVKELLSLMESQTEEGKINASIKSLIHSSDSTKDSPLEILLKAVEFCHNQQTTQSKICAQLKMPVKDWKEEDILQWAKELRKQRCDRNEYFSWNRGYLAEIMAVLIQTTKIYKGYPPRHTQLIALALFLEPNSHKGRLANISTGEGKSLITAMLAAALALIGDKVDIVTSSKVLAIRDASNDLQEGYQKFFNLLDLKASNNCDEACDAPGTGEIERRQRYKDNDIIYGETGYFQRDILLTDFFGKAIRPAVADSLLVDEVDNMFIDNAEKTLYISHSITDMRHLRDLFIRIWFAVHSHSEQYYSEENVMKIYEYIQISLESDELQVPDTLKSFVDSELKIWIENAYHAKYIESNDNYIIGDADSQKQGEVLIMDKDTGVEQMSSRWSQGLHQFLQLKHASKLSDESLKAVFMSNLSFFKRYQYLNGMTGTIGDDTERKLFAKEYDVTCYELPRFRKYRFNYEKSKEWVCATEEEWQQRIIADIDERMAADCSLGQDELQVIVEKHHELGSQLDEIKSKLGKSITFRQEMETQKVQLKEEITNLQKEKATRLKNTNLFEEQYSKSLKELDADYLAKKMQLEETEQKLNKSVEIVEAMKNNQRSLEMDNKCYSQLLDVSQRDKRRAVLIICENVAEVENLASKLRKAFEGKLYKIYTYDRAYRKFKQEKLHPGDIIIATNIAGRGTDLGTDPLVEANGGLHVILSYMPTNKRVATQAFGRTARAGKKGTGVYIVKDERKIDMIPNMTIDFLLEECEEQEQEKMLKTLSQSFPRIKLEDELFAKFQLLKKEIEQKLIPINEQKLSFFKIFQKSFYATKSELAQRYIELQLQSLQNHWAFWLNKINPSLTKLFETNDTAPIWAKFEKFNNKIIGMLNTESFGLIIEPAEIAKLGKLYLDHECYESAQKCFDELITKYPKFAEMAHYYKAFCILQLKGSYPSSKREAKQSLKNALNLLNNRRSTILTRNHLFSSFNQLNRKKGLGLTANYFAKQNEGEAQILSQHINAIQQAIGYEISEDTFRNATFSGNEPAKIYQELLKPELEILKDARISKKAFVGSQVLLKDKNKLDTLLEELKLDPVKKVQLIALLENHELLTKEDICKLDHDYRSFRQVLEAKKIISTLKIFKKQPNSIVSEREFDFPSAFEYCREEILTEFEKQLIQSAQDSQDYLKRICKENAFMKWMFDREKFMAATKNIVKKQEMLIIKAKKDKLVGRLDNPIYNGVGAELKELLLGKRAIRLQPGDRVDLETFLALLLKKSADTQIELAIDTIKRILKMEFGEKITIVAKLRKNLLNRFTSQLRAVELEKSEDILKCLENLIQGNEPLSLKTGDVIAQSTLMDALMSFRDGMTAEAAINILQHLQDPSTSMQLIEKENEYYLEQSSLDKIEANIDILPLNCDDQMADKLDQLELVCFGFSEEQEKIIKQKLKDEYGKKANLTQKDFNLTADKFSLLKAILQDYQISPVISIINLLTAESKPLNPSLETIIMRFYEVGGRISEKNLALRSADELSKELWCYFKEAGLIKEPRVNFELNHNPESRVEQIKTRVEEVVKQVFSLTRQDDTVYTVADWTGIGGFITSNNKKLDEYIDSITEALKLAAGTMRVLPQVQLNQQDLKQLFTEGKVPPELMDYVQMCFDSVLSLKEKKGFDWDAFACAMIGVVQIIAGVALDVCTGGAAHFIAQGLIAEGIGDIVFAIQSSMQGSFSWKAYCQHKVVSLVISLLTAGVGSYLAKGAQSTKMAVGLATKTAILKNVAKETFVQLSNAAITGFINVGSEELSKLAMEELLNKHFITYLQDWLSNNPSYQTKKMEVTEWFEKLYQKFGSTDAENIINNALQATLSEVQQGSLASSISDKVIRLGNGIASAFSKAADRLSKNNSKAALFGAIAKVIDKSITAADYAKSFAELCLLCNDFCDKLESKLADSYANRQAKASKEVDEENDNISVADCVAKHIKSMEMQMCEALHEKIRNEFLKPAMQSVLNGAINPVKSAINRRASKARSDLQVHIDERAEKHMLIIENSENVVPKKITSKKKRALEQLGHLHSVKNLDPTLLNEKVANLGGKTIKQLIQQHGDEVKIASRNGQLHAVVPTYKQYMDHVKDGKYAGPMHIKLAAEKMGCNIEIVDPSDNFKIHRDAPNCEVVTPLSKKSDKAYKIAYIKPKNEGEVGHYAPVIEVDGQQKVIDIKQDATTKDKCLTQTLLFLEKHSKGQIKDIKPNHDYGIGADEIAKFNNQLAKLGKGHTRLREEYHNGLTLKNAKLVGGTLDTIISWNMQGASSEADFSHKYGIVEHYLTNNDLGSKAILLQESGVYGHWMQPVSHHMINATTELQFGVWSSARGPVYAARYYQQNSRCNLVILSNQPPSEVGLVQGNRRPLLGMRIGNELVYNIHAKSGRGQTIAPDVGNLLNAAYNNGFHITIPTDTSNILGNAATHNHITRSMSTYSQFNVAPPPIVAARNHIIMGDFNSNPNLLRTALAGTPIQVFNSGLATQGVPVRQNELDFAIGWGQRIQVYDLMVDNYDYSDHSLVVAHKRR